MLCKLLHVITILTIFLTHFAQGSGNPRGKCYDYINGTEPPTLNCCDRSSLHNPCNAALCREGQICELVYTSEIDPNACDDDYIPLKPRCRVPCNPPKFCKRGCYLVKDLNGCDFCYCNQNFTNPCIKTKPCHDSEICTLQQVQCFVPPCYPIVNCVPRIRCPRVKKCPNNCLKYKDNDGCSRCYCCNNCVNQKCPRKKKCVLEQAFCIRCLCPPLAKCVFK